MKVVQLLLALIVSGIASEWEPAPYTSKTMPMVWVDGRYRHNDPIEIDTLYDRVISLGYAIDDKDIVDRKYVDGGMGVIITKSLILTAFNAFRTVSSKRDSLPKITTFWLIGRYVNLSGRTRSYFHLNRNKINCARQVIPSELYESWPIHMRHGPHSPLHDLMVLRLEKPVEFATPIPPVVYEFNDYRTWKKDGMSYIKTGLGPIRTILAKPGDLLFPDEMKFASLGHINDEHIKENRWLETGEFGAMLDCDEWIPREWGHFICLNNTKKYPGLSSGATLFSDTTLFGVGAFMLKKGGSSVLVFTDVRPYWHLLYRTCTKDDQDLREPAD